MSEKRIAPLSQLSVDVLNALKTVENATIAELKSIVPNVNSANLKALRERNLVEAVEIEIEVLVPVKRKVLRYTAKSE